MENIDISLIYNEQDKQVLKTAEDSLDPHIDRVQEIIEFAKEAKMNRIGIAHCTAFNRESDQLQTILMNSGFKVEKVNCKYGRVPFNDLVSGYKGITCNPAGQAKYLEEKGTELNIMVGLCLGHDMIFNAKSRAPVTPLVVKDRKLQHQTLRLLQQEL
jgi:uncharacterized metal-binding protein